MSTLEEPAATTTGTMAAAEPPTRLRAIAPDHALLNSRQLRTLRELRAELLDLQTLLEGIRTGATTLATYEPYVQKTRADIEALMDSVPPHEFDAETADAICHLHNLWQQIAINPLMLNPATFGASGTSGIAQDQLRHLNVLEDACGRMLFQIGVLTIPARVNYWLSLGRSGYYIPFHEVFAPELPSYEDRVRVLRYLAWSPRVIKYGLVDASTGLIYRYSSSPIARWMSVLGIVLAIALATGLVYLSTHIPGVEGWPLQASDTTTMMAAWVALVGGVVVHVCITVAKRIQEQPEMPPALAIGDVPRMADAKLGPTLLKVVTALIGLFSLVLAAGIAQSTPLQAFLAGYGLDSVVELFGASIERRTQSQLAGLRQQLGVTT